MGCLHLLPSYIVAMPRKTSTPSRPRGRPRPGEVAAIEHILLDVALKEFLQYGYGDAAMDRIAKDVGCSKTTLYSRYPSKEELFRAIIFAQIERASPEAALRSDAGPLSLELGLKSYANHMLSHSLQSEMIGINKLIQSEAYRFPELGAAAKEKTERGIKRISDFISASAERDGIACRHPEAPATVFIFMIRGWYTHLLLTDQKISDKACKHWVEQAVNTLLHNREQW